MYLATIRPTVSADTITKVTRLFNGSIDDIVNELLQNARRAGATAVVISHTKADTGIYLTIADDGTGVADPARMLALGDSGWNSAIAAREDPAGMGVFSLTGKDVTVTSCAADQPIGWSANIRENEWIGEADIPVVDESRPVGTTITVHLPLGGPAIVAKAVEEAAAHYPLPVTLNGVLTKQADFLEGAKFIGEWRGSRIGVFTGRPWSKAKTVNFHGLTVKKTLCEIKETFQGTEFYAKLDIANTPDLNLVLPARKEFVENEALDALKEACARTIFEAIAECDTHSLSYSDWLRARDLGVDLPEAQPLLYQWRPNVADEHGGEVGETIDAASGPLIRGPDFEAQLAQPFARAIEGDPFADRLVEQHRFYEGYEWYDALPEVSAAHFEVKTGERTYRIYEGTCDPALEEHVEADSITLHCVTTHDGRVDEHSFATDVALIEDSDMWYSVIDNVKSAWTKSDKLTPDVLVLLLDDACFCSSDDSECDSWDTQHERFENDAQKLATEILLGEDAAICGQFREAVARLNWLIPPERNIFIEMVGGAIEVRIEAEEVEA
ncbi:MAG: ATP-binding protein [Alteraurantiacibacter sp.]